MKITKDFEGLTRAENGDYVFAGDIITDESIEIELDCRLVVTGGIEAGTFIASRMRSLPDLTSHEAAPIVLTTSDAQS